MKAPQGLLLGIGIMCLSTLIAGPLPVAAADSGEATVPAGKVESLLLSPAAVGDIVGVTFDWEKANRRPYKSDDLGEHSACAMLTGPDVETFGRDYTGYRFRADRDDAENWEFTVQPEDTVASLIEEYRAACARGYPAHTAGAPRRG